MTNRKSHTRFRLCQNQDLGWPWRTITHPLRTVFQTSASFGAHRENLNEGRPIQSVTRCGPMTLDSCNIKFVRIFPGVPWRGSVKRQCGNQKRRSLRLRHLRKWGQPYRYQPLVAFPLTPKYMTLNGHFTFNFQFSLLRTAFRRLGYILIIELFIEYFCMTSLAKMCGNEHSNREAAIRRILRLRERIADLS